jgi:hypothetical protein
MTTASTISTLFGKMARFSPLKRGRRLNHRFLCPNCLHFGGFDFACGECWAEIPDYADGKTQTCPRCQRSLLSADGGGVRAYCKRCQENCACAIYHQRQVRVLATLRPADSALLYRAISGQEYQPQGDRGYVYDDGERLAYVLNLNDFTNKVHSLPQTQALWEVESIWLDVSASDPRKLALELGEAADRFIAQARLTEAQRRAITVCVYQPEAAPVLKLVLEARFGEVKYGVSVQTFLCEKVPTKAVALGEIGHNFTEHAFVRATIMDSIHESYGRGGRQAMETLVKIGKPAVPALSAALKDGDPYVRERAATALGEIGDVSAVPVLNAALKDSDSTVRRMAAGALGEIGDASAAPALSEALKNSDSTVRLMAASALGKIGDVSTVRALSAALKDGDPHVRNRAAWALGKIGDPSTVPALSTSLKDGDPHVRVGAAWALREIGDVSAVPALSEALKNSDSTVRSTAAGALGEIGDASVVPALEHADRKYHSRSFCNYCNALRQLGAK